MLAFSWSLTVGKMALNSPPNTRKSWICFLLPTHMSSVCIYICNYVCLPLGFDHLIWFGTCLYLKYLTQLATHTHRVKVVEWCWISSFFSHIKKKYLGIIKLPSKKDVWFKLWCLNQLGWIQVSAHLENIQFFLLKAMQPSKPGFIINLSQYLNPCALWAQTDCLHIMVLFLFENKHSLDMSGA